jgi:hypothetical protein
MPFASAVFDAAVDSDEGFLLPCSIAASGICDLVGLITGGDRLPCCPGPGL